jgi:HAD superfamily hydrolase (TIGR01509 family)
MKLDTTRFEAVIFDMDGTIVDNMHFHNKAWVEFIRRRKIEVREEEFMEQATGRSNTAILEILFGRKIGKEEHHAFQEEKEAIYREIYKPEFKEVRGFKTFLKKLDGLGIKTGIATNAHLENRIFTLELLGLEDFFTVVIGSEDVEKGKPHPAVYLLAAEKLGVEPQKCLAFEDTALGIKSAKDAGLTVVGVMTSHTEEELNGADYFIKDFTVIKL